MDTQSLVERAFGPLAGKRLLDIGCGDGVLVRTLSALGVVAAGVDPAATTMGPLYAAGAQSLPFEDGAFDGAIFANALHHVPQNKMARGLSEAARVTGPGRTVLVIEPLATGSFFDVLRLIEDETAVRAAAQAAIIHAVADGTFELVTQVDYVRQNEFDAIALFFAKVLAADRSRGAMIEREGSAIAAAFEAGATRNARGAYVLDQPIRAQILKVQPRA